MYGERQQIHSGREGQGRLCSGTRLSRLSFSGGRCGFTMDGQGEVIMVLMKNPVGHPVLLRPLFMHRRE
jgi:hypothetical protein